MASVGGPALDYSLHGPATHPPPVPHTDVHQVAVTIHLFFMRLCLLLHLLDVAGWPHSLTHKNCQATGLASCTQQQLMGTVSVDLISVGCHQVGLLVPLEAA
jgi:hypothetical protein